MPKLLQRTSPRLRERKRTRSLIAWLARTRRESADIAGDRLEVSHKLVLAH